MRNSTRIILPFLWDILVRSNLTFQPYICTITLQWPCRSFWSSNRYTHTPVDLHPIISYAFIWHPSVSIITKQGRNWYPGLFHPFPQCWVPLQSRGVGSGAGGGGLGGASPPVKNVRGGSMRPPPPPQFPRPKTPYLYHCKMSGTKSLIFNACPFDLFPDSIKWTLDRIFWKKTIPTMNRVENTVPWHPCHIPDVRRGYAVHARTVLLA